MIRLSCFTKQELKEGSWWKLPSIIFSLAYLSAKWLIGER